VTKGDLDIKQASEIQLKDSLAKTLNQIDRQAAGFTDFNNSGRQGITAGKPSQSLLYHALASPLVHPTTTGKPSTNKADYPTIEELDTLENYIYSLNKNSVDLTDAFAVVFAYQYRVGNRTAHLKYADFAYSRTGLSRVGTVDSNYVPNQRSFWVLPENGTEAICTSSCRYGVFLAKKGAAGSLGTVQGVSPANSGDFYFPVHKLFNGDECISGKNLQLDYKEYHVNEKLKKLHDLSLSQGGLPLPAGFDTNKSPYLRDSNNFHLINLSTVGSSAVLSPVPSAKLVSMASQFNTSSNQDEVVHFFVPREMLNNRFLGSFRVPSQERARPAPEFVNIRQEIDPLAGVNQTPNDLNQLPQANFTVKLKKGGYISAHFIDNTCDGVLEAVVNGLPANIEHKPAYSLVTAPDFFPLADQIEVATNNNISQTKPLSQERIPINPDLPLPSNPGVLAFDRNELTTTAVVGELAFGTAQTIIGQTNRMVSILPDGASGVFAPGWDVSISRDGNGEFLDSSGLGSPFPEDAKLCAAISSYWPAVAPDIARTFGNKNWPNQIPMLDEELGYHPNHPDVLATTQSAYTGWDGESGPFIDTINGNDVVNYVDIERSDYVVHALNNRIKVSLTSHIQSEDLLERHNVINVCYNQSGVRNGNNSCLVTFTAVADWQSHGASFSSIVGRGYYVEIAEVNSAELSTAELIRKARTITTLHKFEVSGNGVAYTKGNNQTVLRHP